MVAAIPVVIVAVAWWLLPGASGGGDSRPGGPPLPDSRTEGPAGPSGIGDPAAAAPEPVESSGPGEGSSTSSDRVPDNSSRRAYAIALPEIKGLPAEAPPGTRLELWVAWEPPITKEPRVQRLLKGAVVDEIIPPVVPEAPPTVILSVPLQRVPDLLYGDHYGSLSATMLPFD